MVDIHCHLNFKAFEKDAGAVIEKARSVGVKIIVNVGTKQDTSLKAIELAKKYPGLYATVGVHPHHADKLEDDWLEKLEKLAKMEKVIAIGECGLDYYSYKSNNVVDPTLQKQVFIKQLELSAKLKLPLQIHNRLAQNDVFKIINSYKSLFLNPPGVFHCFSGDIDFLRKVLDLGFFVGFDGNITYAGTAKGETTRLFDLVKFAPLDRILVETDSPFLAPEPDRKTRNTPQNAVLVGEFIARIKSIDYNTFEQRIEDSFRVLFLNKKAPIQKMKRA